MSHSIFIYGLIFIFSSLLITISIYFLQTKQRNALKQQQITGFQVLTQLRRLLTSVQQHRGLSNGLLNGDLNLASRLSQHTALVNDIINCINQNYKTAVLDEKSQPLSRWQSITEHWPRLAQNTRKLTPENSLQQHNKLILNILYFIDDISEQHQIYKIADMQGESMHHDWLELLFTAESIGQIRAIGTGVAAGKECTSVERIRLNYLCHSLQQSLDDGLPLSDAAPIKNLLNTISERITIPNPDIEAEQFFNIASECIEIVFNEFDTISRQLEAVVIPRNKGLIQSNEHAQGI